MRVRKRWQWQWSLSGLGEDDRFLLAFAFGAIPAVIGGVMIAAGVTPGSWEWWKILAFMVCEWLPLRLIFVSIDRSVGWVMEHPPVRRVDHPGDVAERERLKQITAAYESENP